MIEQASRKPPVIRVMIVDDHPLVRDGLKVLLMATPDLELAAEASGGEEALRLCREIPMDIVLMDLKMAGMDGVAATRSIRARHPRIQVIALTSYADQKLVHEAIEAGAISYLLKDVSPGELARAIRAAHAGQSTLSSRATRLLAQDQSIPDGDKLTKREQEVLALLVQGLTNAQIARRLTIQPSTVNFHVHNILSKLDAANRTEAVAIAMRRGLERTEG